LLGQSVFCIAAMLTPNRRFHMVFAAMALAYQLSVIVLLLGSNG
jgi:hypothetical protein